MIQPGIEDDSTTSSLYRLTRDWIEHLRSVLYHARVIKTSPLGDDHPLSEDFPFVRKPVSQTFTRFYTRTHFDTQPPLQQGEETSYPVSLVYTPGREEYNASWTITSGSFVMGQLTLSKHLWQKGSDMSWLTADRFLVAMISSITLKRKLRLTSRVWGLQGNPPSDHIVSNLELFELWTEDDVSYHQVIGSRYIKARRCIFGGCGQPLHMHQEQFCHQHSPQLMGV